MTEIEQQLKDHLDNASDWEKMETPIPGVFVVKVPATKTRAALLNLEINPLKDNGLQMKKKGLFVSGKEMLIKFSETLSDDKVYQLINEIERVNPESGGTKKLKM